MNRVFSGKPDIRKFMCLPMFGGELGMLSQHCFDTNVIQAYLIRSSGQFLRSSDLRHVGSMDHERGILTGFSMLRPEKRDHSDGAYGPHVVDSQVDGRCTKQV